MPSTKTVPLDPAISTPLSQFGVIFAKPNSLPLVGVYDHVIPLIPEATIVHIRPYRYPPAIKDEIEKQNSEMLQASIIRPSSYEFCSRILLVRNKDNIFRFCVDYRYLNALNVKWKFPIPVFDQLMDELAVPCGFPL